MSADGRRREAIEAALAVGRDLGLEAARPIVLHDSTHVTIHLSPLPVVARVMTAIEPWMERRAEREIEVAAFLTAGGAPVVPPIADRPGPHLVGACAVTLWRRVEQVGAVDAAAAGAALARAHECLDGYPGELPPLSDALDDARRLLDAGDLGPLPSRDRAFLGKRYEALRSAMETTPSVPRPIHGDPHLGNALATTRGVVWTDWESACRGPVEWDLACLPGDGVRERSGVDDELLDILRALRSVCVSVWSWAGYDRSAEKREAARFHLERLKRAGGP